MDKISSIIPSNSRVTTVDIKASGTARAGSPSFGREQSASMQADRLHNHIDRNGGQAIERHNELMGQREPFKDPKAQIVSKITDKFFNTKAAQNDAPEIRPSEKYEMVEMPSLNLTNTSAKSTPVKSPTNSSANATAALAALANEEFGDESEDQPMVGNRLDVRV